MNHTPLLHIRTKPYSDLVEVTAENGTVPDGGAVVDGDLAARGRRWGPRRRRRRSWGAIALRGSRGAGLCSPISRDPRMETVLMMAVVAVTAMGLDRRRRRRRRGGGGGGSGVWVWLGLGLGERCGPRRKTLRPRFGGERVRRMEQFGFGLKFWE